MKKNALLKLLSVVVGVMVIVASVVCLTIVNATDDFGTVTDGIISDVGRKIDITEKDYTVVVTDGLLDTNGVKCTPYSGTVTVS